MKSLFPTNSQKKSSRLSQNLHSLEKSVMAKFLSWILIKFNVSEPVKPAKMHFRRLTWKKYYQRNNKIIIYLCFQQLKKTCSNFYYMLKYILKVFLRPCKKLIYFAEIFKKKIKHIILRNTLIFNFCWLSNIARICIGWMKFPKIKN